jgi:hypothetical protein
MAVITKESVIVFVQTYYELRVTTESVKEKCQKMYERNGKKLPMSDIYNIFWAIRVLAEPGKYDQDDIEFHVNKNPFFAEIPTDYNEDEHARKPKQVALLRQAIREYSIIFAGKVNMVPLNAKL